ncbi:UPF0149 family protein [Pseudomonas jinjuensis]|uniref:YecA family protein n=2 Tax=Pseudomonas jinjuensis TaxID=198616 RepID=A0A1H0BU21_9PSED|nr:uncharacterized protein SAMN05216193_103193 [Pseudomonas jinjuensis]
MKNMDSLNVQELDLLAKLLDKHHSSESLENLSELEGFAIAIISGPKHESTGWYSTIWGGVEYEPEWKSEAELQRFLDLLLSHMTDLDWLLTEHPEIVSGVFDINSDYERYLGNVEGWCFGFMRGVQLHDWSAWPQELQHHLEPIALHGLEENYERVDEMTQEEYQASVAQIMPAVLALHAYWRERRPAIPQPTVLPPKIGRNDPCPCGSGKKYKHCCMH